MSGVAKPSGLDAKGPSKTPVTPAERLARFIAEVRAGKVPGYTIVEGMMLPEEAEK